MDAVELAVDVVGDVVEETAGYEPVVDLLKELCSVLEEMTGVVVRCPVRCDGR